MKIPQYVKTAIRDGKTSITNLDNPRHTVNDHPQLWSVYNRTDLGLGDTAFTLTVRQPLDGRCLQQWDNLILFADGLIA